MIKARVRETGQVIYVVFHDRIRTTDGETEVWRDLRGYNLYKTGALDFQNIDSSNLRTWYTFPLFVSSLISFKSIF